MGRRFPLSFSSRRPSAIRARRPDRACQGHCHKLGFPTEGPKSPSPRKRNEKSLGQCPGITSPSSSTRVPDQLRGTHLPGLRDEGRSMVTQFSAPKQLREHAEGTRHGVWFMNGSCRSRASTAAQIGGDSLRHRWHRGTTR